MPTRAISAILLGALVLGCGLRGTPSVPVAEKGEAKAGEFAADSVKVGDTPREYRLVVPKTVDLSKPNALMRSPSVAIARRM